MEEQNLSEEGHETLRDEKGKIVMWFEKNKIWFATILPLVVSIVVAVAGVASSYSDYKQAQLTAMEIENQNREKQPFFAITQEYKQESGQYIYTIKNTGGEVRYSNLNIMPILCVTHYGKDGSVSNEAFISLPGLYQYEITDEDDLIAFSDEWIDTTLVGELPIRINDSNIILVNDYLMHLCSKNNSYEKEEYVTGSLIYWINVSYYDYRNEEKYENIWCGRSGDLSGMTEGNNTLFIQPSLEKWYFEEENHLSVDSMNLSLEDIVTECEVYIDELLMEWGQ